MSRVPRPAILLMAYGSPETPDQVEAYFTHIRGGRAPSPEAVAHLRHRYELVGGRTPLLEITRALRDALAARAEAHARPRRVYVGMKHWHPYIGDTMRAMAADGVTQVTALALAPHFSRISIGGYRKAVDDSNDALGRPFDVTFVDAWHLEPAFIALVAARVRETLAVFEPGAPVTTVFSAHSLPVRIREWRDPYESQLLESCAAVAQRAGLTDWRFAWQSAGNTSEPWLGPDICDYLEALHAEGVRRVLSVPIGFTCDHLEVLFDIDHEAKERADALGMELRRTRMPNASPEFVATIDAIVARADRASRSPLAISGRWS